VIRAIRDRFARAPLLAKRFNQDFLHKAFGANMHARKACHAVAFSHLRGNIARIAPRVGACKKLK
jgi:hypothetical protein